MTLKAQGGRNFYPISRSSYFCLPASHFPVIVVIFAFVDFVTEDITNEQKC
jgi:hypothetical protein